MSEWISIEDQKPPAGVECLFYRPLAENSGDKPVAVKIAIDYNNYCWEKTVPDNSDPVNYSEGCCHTTHWMPLPEPPNGE